MSSPSEINGLTPAEIFRNGTRKRLRPFTGIGVMEMLRAIGHTHKSYTEWCEGISDFKYETIRRIDRFFADRGMPGFAAEFVPGLPAAAGDIFDPLADHCFWIDGDGLIHRAGGGHLQWLRRHLEIPETEGDISRFMIANLGWIAMTLVAGGQVHLQWSKQMVTAHAGRRLSRFIEEHARQIRSIAAIVDGVCHEGIRRDTLSPLLGTAVTRLLIKLQTEPKPWRFQRLPLMEIKDPGVLEYLRAIRQGGEPYETAVNAGIFDQCNVFLLSGDEPRSTHIGTALPVDQNVRGRSVLDRDDAVYALDLKRRLIEATEIEDGTLYRIEQGDDISYMCVSIASGNTVTTIPIQRRSPAQFCVR